MGVRQFGANVGAGVRVVERQPARPVLPGVLGFTLFVGAFRSGPVGEVVISDDEGEQAEIYGGLVQGHEAPLNVAHFYRMARGSGKVACLRVTDGTELAAKAKIYDRRVSRSVLSHADASRVAQVVATVDDASKGRAGGRARYQSGLLDAITDSNTVSITIGAAAPKLDEWKGAALSFPDLPGESYIVDSNTAAAPSAVTVVGELSAAAQALTSSNEFVLALENVHEVTGRFEGVAVEITDSAIDPNAAVSVLGYRDNAIQDSWTDGDFVADGGRYLPDAINQDDGNYLIDWTADPDWAGSPSDPLARPANYAEVPEVGGLAAATPNVLTLQTWRWVRVSAGGGTAWVQGVVHPTTPKAAVIVLTFTSATAFTVAATLDDGGEVLQDLPAGSTAAGYDSGSPFLPTFRIRAGGSAMASGNTITIYYRPLPLNLGDKGGYLYVAASEDDGNVRKKYRIASNTADTLTFATSVDLTDDVVAPVPPSVQTSPAGPYTVANGETLIYTLPDTGEITLTNTLVGSQTAAALATHLQTLEDTSAGAAELRRVTFTALANGKIEIAATADGGAEATLIIGAGTINTPLGLTATTHTGTDATIVRLQWRQELRGGYDGIAGLTAAMIANALDLDTSPANVLITTNTGLIRVCAPGWSDDEVNEAGTRWAWNTNSLWYAEIDDAITDEGDAIDAHAAWALDAEKMGYQCAYFPSYGKIKSPYVTRGAALYTTSVLGAILGIEALRATEANGFHLAPAGEPYDIGEVFRDLATGDTALDNEALNAYGLIELRKRDRKIYPWGDRIATPDGADFKHKRAALSHIGRVLLTNVERLVWQPINESTFSLTRSTLRDVFTPWFKSGWFADDAGTDFADQVQIKCDATNNPPSTRAAGNLHTEIGVLIVDTAERVIFTLGPRGVAESAT